MCNLLLKEMRLSASILSYLFILFGLMFLLPGYPILCGAFFASLGLFYSFQTTRETNDIVFSALLPVAKRNVVKGKYLFVCMIESCTLVLMLLAVCLRMTIFLQTAVYRNNTLMNANFFALGAACVIFCLFNSIFVRGFFKTTYKLAKPLITFIIACFVTILAAETAHHIPGLEWVNAFGTEQITSQLIMLATGILIYLLLTVLSYRKACHSFERIDL